MWSAWRTAASRADRGPGPVTKERGRRPAGGSGGRSPGGHGAVSAVVAERGPGPRPGRPQARGDVDLHALLVVADAHAVPERAGEPDVGELAVEKRRVQVHRDGG